MRYLYLKAPSCRKVQLVRSYKTSGWENQKTTIRQVQVQIRQREQLDPQVVNDLFTEAFDDVKVE